MTTKDEKLQLIDTILQNILNNPTNDKYKNLNAKRVATKLGDSSTYLNWLFNAGFHLSEDGKRLVFAKERLGQLHDVHETLHEVTGQLAQKQTNFTPMKSYGNSISALQQLSTAYNFGLQHTDCVLSNCQSLRYLGSILQMYNQFEVIQNEAKSDVTLDLLFDDSVLMLNHFHHLLITHEIDFEKMYHQLVKMCGDCKVNKCMMLRRNCRSGFDETHECQNESNTSNTTSNAPQQRLLDRIHCYFFHTFHFGHKLTQNDKNILSCQEMKQSDEKDIIFDKAHSTIELLIKSKRDSYSDINKLGRTSNKLNRFNMFNTINEIKYDTGIRFFYWDYYRYATEVNDTSLLVADFMFGTGKTIKRGDRVDANEGYSVRDWYIAKKYLSLKEELLNNEVCVLPQFEWNVTESDASKHLQCEYARPIKSRSVSQYDIKALSSLNLDHVIAMMTYCNNDKLQAQFSETYRRRNNEDDHQLKTRHANYANFARLLRELTECYGQRVDGITLADKPLWHGIAQKTQFTTINPCFKGPLSSTMSYAVAVNFCNNTGCILEFRLDQRWIFNRGFMNGNDPAAFMDCAWLSNYPSEQERFFIGGFASIYIETIIITPATNYASYIVAMRGILTKLKSLLAHNPIRALSDTASQLAFRILSNEFNKYSSDSKYQPFKSLPKYVDMLFHSFCVHLRSLVLFGFGRGGSSYERLDELLDYMFLQRNEVMINLEAITTIFPSLKEIWIETNCFGKPEDGRNLELIKNENFWIMLLRMLMKQHSLRTIIIRFSFQSECKYISETVKKKYGCLFVLAGWHIALVTSYKYSKPEYALMLQSNEDVGREIKMELTQGTDHYTILSS